MQKQLTDPNHKPTHDEIARVAYAIFEKNGRIPGRDVQNWLEAEAQLRSASKPRQTKSVAAAPAKPAQTKATATTPAKPSQTRPAVGTPARAAVNH